MAPSEEQLERNKKKRTALRTATTRLLTKLEKELQAQEPDSDTIEELLAQLEGKQSSLDALDIEIEDGIEDLELLEVEIMNREEYKERIIIGRMRANRHMRKSGCRPMSRVERVVLDHDGGAATEANFTAQVKLPRLAIAKFNGDACAWQGFWAQYNAAIHENRNLADVEKYNYLKTYLEGPAERAIAGPSLTADNYQKAIEILISRFGRKDILINAHMNRLLSLQPVKKANDVSALRKLYDNCEVQIRSLETMGMVSETYGGLLCPLLFKIIPDELALAFNRQRKEGEELTVTKLLTYIRKEVESLESTHLLTRGDEAERNTSSSIDRQKPKSNQQVKDQRNPRWPTAATLNVTVEDACIFCENTNHKADECEDVSIAKKKELLKEKGRCYICYKKRHLARNCRAKVVCPVCSKRHRKALCFQAHPEGQPEKETLVASLFPDPNFQTSTVLLQTVKAMAVGPVLKREVRCLLDGGSQRTFIHEGLSRKLQLPIVGEEELKIYTFGKEAPIKEKRRRVKLTLSNQAGTNSVVIEALETPEISAAVIQVPNTEIQNWTKDLGINLSDTPTGGKNRPLALLVGADYYWRIVSGKMTRLTSSLVLMDTLFGWSVQGPIQTSDIEVSQSVGTMKVAVSSSENKEYQVSSQLERFWKLDSLGITDVHDERSISNDDVFQQFKSTVSFKEERYEVRLPWKVEGVFGPSGYSLAKKRLESLVKRLRKSPNLYKEYQEIIDDHLKQGIAEKVTEYLDNNETEARPIFYLPHQAVVRRDKTTTKVRVVFDASAHEPRAPSLNTLLHPGPNLNPDLLNVLIGFRISTVAFVADIEKAFLQISLAEEDRDAVRFLWIESMPQDENEPLKIIVLRMTRVLFGVTSSPFLLAAVVKHHLSEHENESPKACRVLDESLYVDDLIDGASSEDEAFQITIETKRIMAEAGMSLRKWRSNSEQLRQLWEDANFDTSSTVDPLGEDFHVIKVLGLVWNTQDDTFRFDLSHLLEFLTHSEETKRGILQAVGRIFDPVGFLSPFTITVKILFQELWKKGLQWDEPLPQEVRDEWKRWCAELPALNKMAIQRHYFAYLNEEDLQDVQLHCYVDASEKAYGAVAYLRYTTRESKVDTVLLASKTRVAPLKRLSVPRLELMGALIGARLVNHISRGLRRIGPIQNNFWTDSVITLCWVKSTSDNWKPFVENRVREIQDLTHKAEWQHCPGTENPADLITRGKELSKFVLEERWWKGPRWLSQSESQWPKLDSTKICQTNPEEERVRKIVVKTIVEERPCEPIVDVSRYSSLTRLLRTTAWILRFTSNVRQSRDRISGPLSSEEMSRAESYWIKQIQAKEFKDELKALKKDKEQPKGSRLVGFNPFLDKEGQIRLGGRLQHSNLPYEEKHPLLIPDKNEFAMLLIQDSHVKVAHSGITTTLTQVRGQYWILRGRQLTKSVINRCFICKRYRAKPAAELTAPFPGERIQRSPPFEVTGVDFAGPVYVKGYKGNEKAYIALYTCAVTRAVHLEIVTSLTTEAFILSFKRFIARRGICKVIYSDNAKTFKAADKELQELWNRLKKADLKEFFGNQKIDWRFIVEHAAWWGGFWERMVRSIKASLKRILGKALLTFEELTTVLVQVEAIINSRPLTYSYDGTEEPSPLTPAHFLIGKRLTAVPDGQNLKNTPTSATEQQLRARKKYYQLLLDHFWERWKTEYLLELRSAHFQTCPKRGPSIRKGDVVLLSERRVPRQMWRIGRIQEVHVGRDGKVRACTLKIPGSKEIRRPIQLLYPLEVDRTSEVQGELSSVAAPEDVADYFSNEQSKDISKGTKTSFLLTSVQGRPEQSGIHPPPPCGAPPNPQTTTTMPRDEEAGCPAEDFSSISNL